MTQSLRPGAAAWAAFARSFRTRLHESGLERLDIRWRFRVVVLAFGLPFLAYIVWSATQQAALEKIHVRDRARANATLVASRFEDHVEQIDRLMAAMSQSIGGHMQDVAGTEQLLQSMRGYVPKAVDNIGVWSLGGDSLAALDRRAATRWVNILDRGYYRDAIAHRDLAFEGPIRSRTTGVDIIQFARPIFDAKDQIVGVITMAIRAGQLISLVDPDGNVANTSLVTILNDHGTIVSRSVEPGMWVGKQVEDPTLTAAFANRSGTREETGIDGQQRLAGYAVVGRWPWIVMVGEPIERVVGPISDRLLANLGLGLAIFALAMLIAGRVAAWTATPLIRLAADAERLGRGELWHRSDVATGGEIATLAANFNRMAAAIEQRDIALAASRTQLRAIADNVPEQITYVDREERYRFVSAQAGPFESARPADMIGRTVREIRGDDVYRVIAPALHRAIGGERHSSEKSVMVNEREKHFSLTYVPDLDANGEVRGVYAFANDITPRKTAELLLVESEKRLSLITNNLPAMICYIDATRCFRFANGAFEKWFERPLDTIIGQPFDRLMAPELAVEVDRYFQRGLRGETLEYELQVPVRDRRTPRWLKCSFIPDLDEATGKVRGVYGMLHDVSKAKEAEQRLTRLAQFDTLTGLANRHQFNETFARILAANDRAPRPLALMFLDIDHFKQVNDRHGHASGDRLLHEFAQRLAECVHSTDAVARLSGDEFVVLLEGLHSDDEPQFIARTIIAAVAKPFLFDDRSLLVTTSIGIAMRAHVGEPASALMKRADEALYEAKGAGRNTFRMAS